MNMNTFHNSFKYLRLINVKSALSAIKETKPRHIKLVSRVDADVFSKANTAPRAVGVEIGQKYNEGSQKQDPMSYIPIINPRSILPLMEDTWQRGEVGLPTPQNEEKQAVRLIVIRRKKMRKHQRRKLWKKMRYRWAKIKQKRRQIKEKNFQNELLALMKKANEFSAEQYVAQKIEKANHTPLPKRWRGKRLPEFIIRQLMGLDKKINYKHTDVYKA